MSQQKRLLVLKQIITSPTSHSISLTFWRLLMVLSEMFRDFRYFLMTDKILIWWRDILPFIVSSLLIAKLRARLLSSHLNTCPNILHIEPTTRLDKGFRLHFLYRFTFKFLTLGYCILTICLKCFLRHTSNLFRVFLPNC